jgi:hypothetical protein
MIERMTLELLAADPNGPHATLVPSPLFTASSF